MMNEAPDDSEAVNAMDFHDEPLELVKMPELHAYLLLVHGMYILVVRRIVIIHC